MNNSKEMPDYLQNAFDTMMYANIDGKHAIIFRTEFDRLAAYDAMCDALENRKNQNTRATPYPVTKAEAVEMLDDFYRIELERFIWKHKTTVAKLIEAAAQQQE